LALMVESGFQTIPKKLHLIWVGDDTKRPHHSIDSWKHKHPAWEFRVWSNAELDGTPWKARRQIDRFRALNHWDGVADLMRYEILHEHGGVYVDADSTCVRALDDWLLDTRMFAVWENERHSPGLIANGFIGQK
jgi:mannosyltransferase OCH1-like enzyme